MRTACLLTLAWSFTAMGGTTVYNVSRTVQNGTVIGFIETDGQNGVLAISDIIDWNLTLTDGVSTVVLTGPLSGNNSSISHSSLLSDLTATSTNLLFNFGSADGGYLLFQAGIFGAGNTYYCDAATQQSFVCGAGEDIVPASVFATTYDPSGPLTGNQVIGTVGNGGSIVYNVSRSVKSGTVTGFIKTDGTTGVLTIPNILDWNLTVTSGGSTFALKGPLSGNNSTASNSLVLSDLSATTTNLLFNFGSGDQGFLLFQGTGLYATGEEYYCDAATQQSFVCGAGEDIVPVSVTAASYDPSGPLTGNQVIGTTGVIISSVSVNGSFANPGTLAPGSIASVFATGIPNTIPTETSGVFPSVKSEGVEVTFNGEGGPMFHLLPAASPQQIDLFVPSDLPTTGSVNVQVATPTSTSPNYALNMVPASPSLFRFTDPKTSNTYAVVQFANSAWVVLPAAAAADIGFPACSASTGALVECGQPANTGDVLVIYLTGLGMATVNGGPSGATLPTGQNPPLSGSPLYETPTLPTVTIGGLPAAVAFSGLTPGFAGEYQIDVTVPGGVPTGDSVPVKVTMLGASDTANISIQSNRVKPPGQ